MLRKTLGLRLTAMSLCLCAAFGCANVFAAETDNTQEELEEMQQSLNDIYSIYINIEYNDELETLTVDEAVEKAINNSSSLKNISAQIDLAEDQLDVQYSEAMADSGDSFSSLISFIESQASLSNNKISEVVQEETVKHSMEESYINIVKAEREIALLKLSIEKSDYELGIAKVQLANGRLSQSEYNELEQSYNSAKTELENREDSLEAEYAALNILMGVADTSKRYNLYVEAVYEPFNIDMPVESYINGKVAASASVRQAEKDYETTQQTYSMSIISNTEIGGYKSAQNSLNSAEMSYEDTKDSVYNSLYSKYNSLVENEKSYESQLNELSLLNDTLLRVQTQYASGRATYTELLQACYDVAEKENNILSGVYDHMLLCEELTNVDLM